MSEPGRYGLEAAVHTAEKFLEYLRPYCQRIQVVGSIRRRKPFVKDIEFLIVTKIGLVTDPTDLFAHQVPTQAAHKAVETLLTMGVIAKRLNVDGHPTWGEENKLAKHVKSEIPLDFFFTTEMNWFNALVVRTGPTKSNKAIAAAAKKMGWNWHAYGCGFTRGDGENAIDRHVVKQERDAFDFVGIPYLKPEKR